MYTAKVIVIFFVSLTLFGCIKENTPSCSDEMTKSKVIEITRLNYRDALVKKEKNEVFRSKEYQDFFMGETNFFKRFAINYIENYSDLDSLGRNIGCPAIQNKVIEIEERSHNAGFNIRDIRVESINKEIEKGTCAASLFSREDFVVEILYSVQFTDDKNIYVSANDVFQ